MIFLGAVFVGLAAFACYGVARLGLPLSEVLVLLLFRLAAWIEACAMAWDAAILSYRVQRCAVVISRTHLESAQFRLGPVRTDL